MTEAQQKPAVVLENVDAAFDGRVALEDVSFDVARGAFSALIGPNGAGKSTCLRLVLGLLRPSGGSVRVFDGPPGENGALVGYVPQRVVIPRGFPITVMDVVMMGRTGVLGAGRRPGPNDRAKARGSLDRVGLADLGTRRFQDLSGGQQQRVLIARALCGEPEILLLDEPTAGLDSAAQARFYALVCDLQHAQGLTLLCATHDLDVVGDHADSLILLDRTVRAWGPPHEVLAGRSLREAYRFPEGHRHDGAGGGA